MFDKNVPLIAMFSGSVYGIADIFVSVMHMIHMISLSWSKGLCYGSNGAWSQQTDFLFYCMNLLVTLLTKYLTTQRGRCHWAQNTI